MSVPCYLMRPGHDNLEKASTYINRAFNGEYNLPIAKCMQSHISQLSLIDILSFDRNTFEKNLSLVTKKKTLINSRWISVPLGNLCHIYQPKTLAKHTISQHGTYKVYGANGIIGYYDKYNHENREVALTCRGATCGCVNYTEPKSWITGNAMVISPKSSDIDKVFLYNLLANTNLKNAGIITGTAQPQITRENLSPFKIPVPPINIQKNCNRNR